MEVLSSCYWPCNVRELENCIVRKVTIVQGGVIRDFAFPCKQNRCLTQTLHFMDKADAVAAVPAQSIPMLPSRRASEVEPAADGSVTRIGPTRLLTPSPGGASHDAPPEGEKENLIWAMVARKPATMKPSGGAMGCHVEAPHSRRAGKCGACSASALVV